MWRLFKMTPLQGEPARESNRTCIGLLQQGPGEISQTNSAWTFWGDDAKCCQDGHRFSPETSLSSQWRYPNSWGSNRPPACTVLSLRWNWRSSKGWVLWHLLTIIRFFDPSIASLQYNIILCFSFNFQLWLATSLPSQTNYWLAWWDNSTFTTSHTSYNTTWSKSKTTPHHLWQCRLDWLMILPIFHNLPCEGWWPESESGPEKMTANEGAESLSLRFADFMFQQQGHFPTKHQHGMMANWRQNDAKGL